MANGPTIAYKGGQRFEDTSPTVLDNPLEKLLRTGKRGANWLSDLIGGSNPEEEAQTAIASLANPIGGPLVTALGSPLRNAAYRTQLLRKLGEQIQGLEPGPARDMFMRLLDTHPRVASAFQHSGGILRRDPAYSQKVVQQAIASGQEPTRFGQFTPGAGELVPDLRNVQQGPLINITPQSFIDALDPDQFVRGVTGKPGIDMADTAAHEMTHWAQALGGTAAKRKSKIAEEVQKMVERKATALEAMPIKIEHRLLTHSMEQAADKAGSAQSKRLERYLADKTR
jgi:hypothetical protein